MFYFSIQLGISSSQLTFMFFRGVETTNQIVVDKNRVSPSTSDLILAVEKQETRQPRHI